LSFINLWDNNKNVSPVIKFIAHRIDRMVEFDGYLFFSNY